MPSVDLTNEQVIDLVRQLPPDSKRQALFALAEGAEARRDQRLQLAEDRLRQLCAQRGLDWNAMTEEQRETFIDDLVHELNETLSSEPDGRSQAALLADLRARSFTPPPGTPDSVEWLREDRQR